MKSYFEVGCFIELFLIRVLNIGNEFKLKFIGEWKYFKVSYFICLF